ncbi:HAMP domain-containing sensor histidine kinase [Acetobacterium tundrae]|uniref:sensor histidine kinase n=1 Tax=Acetobacterium tundrae TaxID=132932 RepID=UPI0028803E2F|nr:HAMP domain-containing sensor histidine kinase [Acetobacterium tundrae]
MKGLTIALSLLIFLVGLLAVYIGILQYQLHSMNSQLDKRLREKTRQPLSLELINPELNCLAANMNKSLKAEETLRLSGIREEKQFKEMIANISHDLRTPLTAIKGYQQLMEKEELTEDQQAKLHIAQKHADELGNLIQHFFEYSYLLNAESEPTIEGFNLTNLVAECLAESVAVFEENNLSVCFKEGPSVFAFGDQEMTTRIVKNLIRNCIAHSLGNVRVEILAEEHAVISFKNPVMNPQEIDVKRLFDRFYTADKARGKTTGLGLSIVKSLVEKMNGHTKANLQEYELEIRVELPLWEMP